MFSFSYRVIYNNASPYSTKKEILKQTPHTRAANGGWEKGRGKRAGLRDHSSLGLNNQG